VKRLLVTIILVLAVGAGGWMGSRVAGEWSRLSGIDAGIREQEGVIQAAREEAKKIREEIGRAGADIAAADSLGADRVGLALDRSFDIAKMESGIEQSRIRAQRRLRHLNGEREVVAKDLRRWALALAGVEAFLIGGLVVVWRHGSRRG
jgi:hypothetical protein